MANLCKALLSSWVLLPHQAVMFPDNIYWCTFSELVKVSFPLLAEEMKVLLGLFDQDVCVVRSHQFLGVEVVHPLHCVPVNLEGGVVPLLLLLQIHNQLTGFADIQ